VSVQTAAEEVAEPLLAHLRQELGEPGLAYAEPPAAVIGGFDTKIYDFRLSGGTETWSPPLILRVFPAHADRLRARREAAVHGAVVGMGFPAPRVLLLCEDAGILGGTFVVMERVPGRMMLADVFSPSRVLFLLPRVLGTVPRTLGETQARLHSLDGEALLRALDEADVPAACAGPAGVSRRMATVGGQLEDMQRRVDAASLNGLAAGLEWLLAKRPAEPERLAICHGDFHPLNVLMEGDRVSGVIDWAMTVVADPAFDVGNTKVLLALAPLDLPAVLRPLASAVCPAMAKRYYEAYRRHRAVDAEAVRYYEALRCVMELLWVGESRRAAAGDAGQITNPWAVPRMTERLLSHFRKVTGVVLSVPSVR
jgi:aminoglycoside phosphotransferase (APT) family kinase protein